MADKAARDIEAMHIRDKDRDDSERRDEVYEALRVDGNPNEAGHTVVTGYVLAFPKSHDCLFAHTTLTLSFTYR